MEQLTSVITKLDQIDSLMFAIEGTYLDACVGSGEESARFCNLLYLLWEQIDQVREKLLTIRGTHQ